MAYGAYNMDKNENFRRFRRHLHQLSLHYEIQIIIESKINFSNFPFFQLWVRALLASFFQYKSNLGYHRFDFFKTHYQTFLHLNLTQLTCTFRLHPLYFVIFLQNPKIRVVNVFIHSYLNFHLDFPNVSWFKSMIFWLSNAPSTIPISFLDPELSQMIFQMWVYSRPYFSDFMFSFGI